MFEGEQEPVPRDRLVREAAHCVGLLVLLTDRVDAALLAAAPRLRVVYALSGALVVGVALSRVVARPAVGGGGSSGSLRRRRRQ
jgi:phosphoglycerate dehydrogenase-like enzyme